MSAAVFELELARLARLPWANPRAVVPTRDVADECAASVLGFECPFRRRAPVHDGQSSLAHDFVPRRG